MVSSAEFWSILASVISVILGVVAIAVSIYFFVTNQKTEKNVSNSLTKIETQTDMLQKITGRQIDRLTKFVTEPKSSIIDESLPDIISRLTELPQTMLAQIQQSAGTGDESQLPFDTISCYIGLYYYTAQTNYWSQLCLPDMDDFNQDNDFHQLAKRVVDLTASDFTFVANILKNFSAEEVESSQLKYLFDETQDFWKKYVRSSADVFISRQSAQE